MGVFGRGGGSRKERSETSEALLEWVQAHRGVEVYVEPKTAVTANSILLVAHDSEFARRRVLSPAAALAFSRKQGLPIYDANDHRLSTADAGLLAAGNDLAATRPAGGTRRLTTVRADVIANG